MHDPIKGNVMDTYLVRAQIDLDAIEQNVRALKATTGKKTKFMAVVKADGYGHGAVKVAQAAVRAGADWLGVARFHEAEQLRDAGFQTPILIFGYVHPQQTPQLIKLDLIPTIYNLEMATAFSRIAIEHNQILKVHLKVDTGMGRVGMLWEDAATETKRISGLKGISLKGVYTHFAAADSKDPTYTRRQLDRFTRYINRLKSSGIDYGICHAANSAGIIEHPDSHFDMVRAGISLYGLFPSPEVSRKTITLKPAMTLKSIITSVRPVPQGFNISYGMTFRTPQKTKIASVPVGYADGYSRGLSSKGFMLVNGEIAPIRGRVCMDQTIIDVGHISGVRTGDEVVLMGTQNHQSITADDLASLLDTINYEVVSSITARVPRVYEGITPVESPSHT